MLPMRLTGLMVGLGLLTACPADDPDSAATGTGDGGTADADTSVDGTSIDGTGVADGESDATEDSADSTGGEAAGIPAAGGIVIDYIEANQGIGVRIGADGEWVGAEGRTAPLAANRLSLVRVFWAVPDDWTPREIEGRATFYLPDGTTVTSSETKMVEGDSFVGSLNETFNFGLQAKDAVPGVGYSVALYEVDEAFADPSVTEPPRLPANEESVLVGVEDSYQKLKVVLVPFTYNNGAGCVTEPDLTDETMQLYADKIFQMNPIDTLEFEIHETLSWDTELASLGEINQLLAGLRFDEGAPPETYYYGHIDVCAGGVDGAAGLANGIPVDPTMDNAFQRVSSGVSFDPELSAETFVHEVGHSQGRRHIACDGEGGVDITYPEEGGAIGEWGFGVIDFALRHPTVTKDYMTYCTPTWVSNFGWNKVWPTIEILSSWDAEAPADTAPNPYGDGSVLVGLILKDGKEIWSTVPGGVPAQQLTDAMQVEFSIGGGRVALHNTRVEQLPDSDDLLVVTPLPKGFDAVDQMARVVGPQRFEIVKSSVSVKHHMRTVRR